MTEELTYKISTKQAELWRVADAEIRKIGGLGRISRNPDPTVRKRAKTEGTREWALMEASRVVSPANDGEMTDEFCDKLIAIITK